LSRSHRVVVLRQNGGLAERRKCNDTKKECGRNAAGRNALESLVEAGQVVLPARYLRTLFQHWPNL
jgi:hypothetical protein